ncbi:MAG TPA: hypothetical protein VFV34_06630, partial [Blastocatellia bacterium]|nr:hypothetical protein [Blastocatellia bacterium]
MMRIRLTRPVASGIGLLLSISLAASAQWDKKPSTEWSEKEAQKLLNDSPWAHTQVYTSAETLFREPSTGSQGVSGQATSANTANATHINFRIRFLSAKPVRLAISRVMELKQKKPLSPEMAAQLKSFAEGEFREYIVVTVMCDS